MIKRSVNKSVGYLFRQSIISSRPISWINTAFPFMAGYLASNGSVSAYFWVVSFYFLIPYNFLIYVVNDVFDYESDVKNPRKNSIEGGILPPETHRPMLAITVVFNILVLSYVFLMGSMQANILLAVIIFGAVSYSMPPLRLKEVPFFDSINSSFHFVSPLLFALLLTGWISKSWLLILAFFFWGCASHAFGAVQDIVADRKAHIKSVATYLGAKKTVRLSMGLYLLTALALLIAGWPELIVCLPVLLYVGLVAPYVNLLDINAELANRGWRRFLALNQLTGFVITVILIVVRIK